jgi:hypothetical protein
MSYPVRGVNASSSPQTSSVGAVTPGMILNYLQAHHLDLDFYDQKLRPGSYLPTHARHMATWH